LIVLSKTHAWGSVFAARPYEGPFGAHTCASICLSLQTMMSSRIHPKAPGGTG
jgi:hypothetical protein